MTQNIVNNYYLYVMHYPNAFNKALGWIYVHFFNKFEVIAITYTYL